MANPSQNSGTKENQEMMQGASPQSEVRLIMPIFKEIDANSSQESLDYWHRAQWLRAAVLGANDGLVSTASLMMGIGAVKQDAKAMVLSGLAGLVAGACSMAIGEFVSVYSQLDIHLSHISRERALEASRCSPDYQQSMAAREPRGSPSNNNDNNNVKSTIAAKMQGALSTVEREAEAEGNNVEDLPNPIQAASASAISFAVGALVPLLSAAFVKEHWVRLGVVVGASSLALAGFGGVGAYLGKSSVVKSSLRVLIGGWAAMLVTFGMLRLVRSTGI